MIEAVLSGLNQLATPAHLGLLMVGVVIGMVVGMVPGISTMFAFAMVLPFLLGLRPEAGIPVLIGITASINTADSISSILIGVPGTAAAAASIVDGHAMAQKGEAARALSAAFVVSAVGGLIGAAFLAVSIPIARPLIRQFLSPETLMLCLVGISLTVALTGDRPLRGAIAAAVGLLLAAVGSAPGYGLHRFTFGIPYLWEGIDMILIALGLFAIPEIVDMMWKGSAISKTMAVGKGRLAGFRDALREKWLVLRSSLIGVWIGFLPGLGGTTAAWTAYAHAVQSAKDKSGFGHGDVRGLIGPEAANNACRGGDLMLTLAFGIPGSSSMAIFIVALLAFGVRAGPEMITNHLPLVFMIVWSLAIASVIGAVFCFGLVKPLARVATIPGHVLGLFVLMFAFIGAYQSGQSWADLILLAVLGLLGIGMKRFNFSRPALLISFVLGGLIERYLWLTVQRFGAVGWLARPWVIVFVIVLVVSLFLSIRWQMRRAAKPTAAEGAS